MMAARGWLAVSFAALTVLAVADVPHENIARAREDVNEISRVLHRFAHVEDRSWGAQVSSLLTDLQSRLADSSRKLSDDVSETKEAEKPKTPEAATIRGRQAGRAGSAPKALKVKSLEEISSPRKPHAGAKRTGGRAANKGVSGKTHGGRPKPALAKHKANAAQALKHTARHLHLEPKQATRSTDDWDLEQDIDAVRRPTKQTRDKQASEVLGEIKSGVRGLMEDMQRIDVDKVNMNTYVTAHPEAVISGEH